VLRRLERIKKLEERRVSGKFVGRLEELSVVDLIESFGIERKTGVLTLNNDNNRSGQIFFREGSVINAVLGNFRLENAVYQMLPWEKGSFSMVFTDVDLDDEIAVSNLGLLLEGQKRLEHRKKLLEELPSPKTAFVTTANFNKILEKKNPIKELTKFVSLFDGKRDVLKIIDESSYDDLTTLNRIVKLYNQGFLKLAGETLPPKLIMTEEESTSFQREIFHRPGVSKGSILIIGAEGSEKREMVKAITQNSFQTKTLEELESVVVDLGKVRIGDGYTLAVFGVSVEKQFSLLLDHLSENLSGYIVVIDGTKPQTWEYISYLIHSLKDRFQIPYTLVVTKLDQGEIGSLRDRLSLEAEDSLVPWDPVDEVSAKRVLLSMVRPKREET
jgi:signal recognition particle receptor subunit beta